MDVECAWKVMINYINLINNNPAYFLKAHPPAKLDLTYQQQVFIIYRFNIIIHNFNYCISDPQCAWTSRSARTTDLHFSSRTLGSGQDFASRHVLRRLCNVRNDCHGNKVCDKHTIFNPKHWKISWIRSRTQISGVTVISDASGFGFKQLRHWSIDVARNFMAFIQVRTDLFQAYKNVIPMETITK